MSTAADEAAVRPPCQQRHQNIVLCVCVCVCVFRTTGRSSRWAPGCCSWPRSRCRCSRAAPSAAAAPSPGSTCRSERTCWCCSCRCWRTDTSRHMTRCSPAGHRASVQKATRLEVAQRSGYISLNSKCDFQVAVRLNWRFFTSFKWWRPQLVCAQHPVFIFLHYFLFSFNFFLNASFWYCLMLLWQFVMMPLISHEKYFELPRWNMLHK